MLLREPFLWVILEPESRTYLTSGLLFIVPKIQKKRDIRIWLSQQMRFKYLSSRLSQQKGLKYFTHHFSIILGTASSQRRWANARQVDSRTNRSSSSSSFSNRCVTWRDRSPTMLKKVKIIPISFTKSENHPHIFHQEWKSAISLSP